MEKHWQLIPFLEGGGSEIQNAQESTAVLHWDLSKRPLGCRLKGGMSRETSGRRQVGVLIVRAL